MSEKDTIKQIQEEIIEDFSLFENDLNAKLDYIIDLGQSLPALAEEEKTDDKLVKGCQSKVWLLSERQGDKVIYQADSNTAITKGLIALLMRVLSGQPAEAVAKAELFFMEPIGMQQFIGSQRSNGFVNMINRMKLDAALAYQQTLN
jgi:cysteine desulfuration protein SufE